MTALDVTAPPCFEVVPGVRVWPSWLDEAAQSALLFDLGAVLRDAPLYRPCMPRSGTPFSVQMTNCGALGWFADQKGYRYIDRHPETGRAWPAIPAAAHAAWRALAGCVREPEACLVNWYAPGTRMGLHQDRDESDLEAPVLSLSLGDDALFRIGGARRKDPTRSFRLASGDVMILEGPSRSAFHGVDRIIPGPPRLGLEPGRFNLTLRCVTPPHQGRPAQAATT